MYLSYALFLYTDKSVCISTKLPNGNYFYLTLPAAFAVKATSEALTCSNVSVFRRFLASSDLFDRLGPGETITR